MREGKNEGEGERERRREGQTGGEESLRDSATGLGFSTRDRWSGHGEPFVFLYGVRDCSVVVETTP